VKPHRQRSDEQTPIVIGGDGDVPCRPDLLRVQPDLQVQQGRLDAEKSNSSDSSMMDSVHDERDQRTAAGPERPCIGSAPFFSEVAGGSTATF